MYTYIYKYNGVHTSAVIYILYYLSGEFVFVFVFVFVFILIFILIFMFIHIHIHLNICANKKARQKSGFSV